MLAVVGFAYCAIAILMLFNLDQTAQTLDFIGAPNREEFGFMSIQEWKKSVAFTSWFYLGLGCAAVVCGIGIAMLCEWARISWLLSSAFLGVLFVFLVVRNPEFWSRYIELLLFSVPSVVLLGRKLRKSENKI